ncbi:MAG: 23S rRNA (uracil(1939)-C(5))-methyltransferase RlmD [Firmicutes bacterium]|nr:23S rRNA (uracil(1939)-C(5))-methyltransferase RlmD [Bacillota bacterium]
MTNSESFNGENRRQCPHSEFCGGCLYNGDNYDDVLKKKEGEVRDCFKSHAIDISGLFQGIVGADESHRFAYRNKMEYTFGDFVKDGELQLGMHKKGNFMSIITVDECQLVPDDFNKILRCTLDFCIAHGYKHYNKKSHDGLLRNLIVRRGVRTGEIIVDIVTSSECDAVRTDVTCEGGGTLGFDAEAWKESLIALPLDGDIVGIMHTINDGLADTVACDEQRIIFGRDYYCEEICGLRFKVNVFSFFQTNVEAIERLYTEAVSLIPKLQGKVVYDLFCGTGTISQIVSEKAAHVVGVEIVEDSVEAATTNVALNGITNCKFIRGDVYKVLSDLPAPDVIIVDPPRMGLQTKTVNKVASYGVPEIIYISCNPKTLAADIADFRLAGYEPKYIKAYDNFPWTKHVETVVLMLRE